MNGRTELVEKQLNTDYSGAYVLIRYGAVASYLAMRDHMSHEWRVSRLCSESVTNDELLVRVGEYAHLWQAREAVASDVVARGLAH